MVYSTPTLQRIYDGLMSTSCGSVIRQLAAASLQVPTMRDARNRTLSAPPEAIARRVGVRVVHLRRGAGPGRRGRGVLQGQHALGRSGLAQGWGGVGGRGVRGRRASP